MRCVWRGLLLLLAACLLAGTVGRDTLLRTLRMRSGAPRPEIAPAALLSRPSASGLADLAAPTGTVLRPAPRPRPRPRPTAAPTARPRPRPTPAVDTDVVVLVYGSSVDPQARPAQTPANTKGYSSTYLAMGFANVRAGTQKRRGVFGYPPEH